MATKLQATTDNFFCIAIMDSDGNMASVYSPHLDLDIEEVGQLLRQLLMGWGFHPQNVADLFGDILCEEPPEADQDYLCDPAGVDPLDGVVRPGND